MSSLAERFWAKVNRRESDECWEWQGSRLPAGYGRIAIGGRRNQYAHRLSYELHHGVMPDGMWVLHRCDNPPCVNPAHLYLGTPSANMQDCAGRGRSSLAVLRPADVRRIRACRADLTASPAALERMAHDLRVTPETIENVLSGHTWSHVA